MVGICKRAPPHLENESSTSRPSFPKESDDPVGRRVFDEKAGTFQDCWAARQDVADGEFAAICDRTTMMKAMSWDFRWGRDFPLSPSERLRHFQLCSRENLGRLKISTYNKQYLHLTLYKLERNLCPGGELTKSRPPPRAPQHHRQVSPVHVAAQGVHQRHSLHRLPDQVKIPPGGEQDVTDEPHPRLHTLTVTLLIPNTTTPKSTAPIWYSENI